MALTVELVGVRDAIFTSQKVKIVKSLCRWEIEELVMKEKTIHSFQEYVTYTEKYKNNYLFRGQANKDWNIAPSIFRNDSCLQSEAANIKKEMDNSEKDILTTLFKMQHYGKPTRLLDLTISPLSALFFSIDDASQSDSDGAVYVIDQSQAYSLESDEIELFAEYLIKTDDDISKNATVVSADNILTNDYILKYDYNFSYTNNRSILQGGTALLFGFDRIDGNVVRKNTRSIDNIIHEKIIVPSKIKEVILGELLRIGYDRDILYGTSEFQQSLKSIVVEKDIEVQDRFDFYKIVAGYRLNDLKFNRDDLVFIIEDLYKTFLKKYGENARIWLYFSYDEQDESNGNWVCRTQLSQDKKYTIKWNKDYYLTRLRSINEEISRTELITKFNSKIKVATQIHEDILNHVKNGLYDMNEFVCLLKEIKPTIRKLFLGVSNIGKSDIVIEKFAQAAEQYICNVDCLVDEILLYVERGEKEQALRYWTEAMLKQCNESREKLELVSNNIL
ncbi:MAG: FRG domain-containing protein [Desulfitobacteriaceae bacterium]|nr:FRG domain-containing protein [Desulfitobacteriaceae bacterium]